MRQNCKHYWFVAVRYNEHYYLTIGFYDTKEEAQEARDRRAVMCPAEEYIVIRRLTRLLPDGSCKAILLPKKLFGHEEV